MSTIVTGKEAIVKLGISESMFYRALRDHELDAAIVEDGTSPRKRFNYEMLESHFESVNKRAEEKEKKANMSFTVGEMYSLQDVADYYGIKYERFKVNESTDKGCMILISPGRSLESGWNGTVYNFKISGINETIEDRHKKKGHDYNKLRKAFDNNIPMYLFEKRMTEDLGFPTYEVMYMGLVEIDDRIIHDDSEIHYTIDDINYIPLRFVGDIPQVLKSELEKKKRSALSQNDRMKAYAEQFKTAMDLLTPSESMHILSRNGGRCECCGNFTFMHEGKWYLEIEKVRKPGYKSFYAALCPNCKARVRLLKNDDDINRIFANVNYNEGKK